MQDQDVLVFDDPGLKGALRRSLGNEPAPLHLREQIIRSMRADPSASLPPPAFGLPPAVFPAYSNQKVKPLGSSMRLAPPSVAPTAFSAWGPGMAIAATMLVAIGSIGFFLAHSS